MTFRHPKATTEATHIQHYGLTPAFVGIDVAFAKGKHLPVVIARWVDGRLIPYPLRHLPFEPPRGLGNALTIDDHAVRAFSSAAVEYVSSVCQHLQVRPVRIALDAPSICTPEDRPRRQAEQALDRAGIHCFTTPSQNQIDQIRKKVRDHLVSGGAVNRLPHANQLWMIVGFALFEAFRSLAPCIEVFPQATVKRMNASGTHKSKKDGVALQLSAVARITGWPVDGNAIAELKPIAKAPLHDALDSYLSAWVAALDEHDREPLGCPPDDVIWVPRLLNQEQGVDVYLAPTAKKTSEARAVDSRKREPAARKTKEADHSRICPACNEFEFKRWPFGWDAHAAHKCRGLADADPETRKQAFRKRFLS